MKEAVDKFYIEDAKIKPVNEWIDYKKDGVIYEVIKILKGKPLFYEEHYKRMKNSFNLKGEELKVSENELNELISKLVYINNKENGNIKIIYSLEFKTLRMFFIKHKYPDCTMYKNGVDAIIYFGERNNPNAKILDSKLRNDINSELSKRNAYEAILVNKNRIITEGSRSNVFFIKGSIVYTPESRDVLPGVTRTEILKEAENMGIIVNQKDIKLSELNKYDAVFISGTSPNILPIKRIDKNEFDVNNMILRKLMSNFNLRIEKYID